MKQYAALDDTVYFWFAANDTSGSGGDGASPAADVRLAGAAADAAPVYSPIPVLLSHANYPTGAYEIAIAATAANGFASNNTYAIFCTLAIDAQNPTGFVGSFDLKPIEANITQLGDAAQSATDLKDFADAGYDPATNKIEGCKVNDDMRGTDSAALAASYTATRAGYLDNINNVNLATIADISTLTATEIAYLNASISSRSSHTAANVWAVATRALTDKAGFALSTVSINAIADQVWDELLTGATHNIATSAGRRLREIAGFAVHSGTAQAGTITTIKLEAGADGGDGIFNRNLIVVIGGTGAGQTRTITDYDDTTKVCAVDREWQINPDDTSEYQILADDTPLTVDHGIAREGTLTTITLRASASSVDNIYLCNQIAILGGKGRGQSRLVGGYNGTTKVVTICGDDWVDTPDTTSIYAMIPYGTTCTSCVGSYALAQIAASVAGSGALSCTWTQKDEGGTAMDNVQVWISTDEAGNNVVAGTLITDASGEVTFMLDAGTYYVWRERAGYNFTNPQTWAVS